jgi:hypothetical protein
MDTTDDADGQDIGEECAICQEPLAEKERVTLPCQHSYCSDCLQSWRSKYDSSSGRTCPQCRQTIPPTKEMVNQLMIMKQARDWAKASYEKYKDEPRKAMMEPCFDDMAEAIPKLSVLAMSEDQKNEVLTQMLISRIKELDKKVAGLEETVGDFKLEDLLDQDPNAPKVLDLPHEICVAAANNNIKKVLEWLGDEPIPKERINASNPNKMYRTLLHEAEFENLTGLMSVLLQLGASVDPQSSTGMTPLVQAVREIENEPAARLLLEWGAQALPPGQEEAAWEPATIAGNHALAALMKTPLGGRRCEIVGLQQRSDLNGLTGVATEYMPSKDRYSVQVEQSQEYVLIRSANLKRRDRTAKDPGVYYHFMAESSNGENQFTKGLMVSSDEEAKRIDGINKKMIKEREKEEVLDLSGPVEEIRLSEVDSGNYSLCVEGNSLDQHLDLLFDEKGPSAKEFPAVDLVAGLGVQTSLLALRFRSPAYRASLMLFPVDSTIATMRSGLRFLASEAKNREPLFRDAEDAPVFSNDSVVLKGLSTATMNNRCAKVNCQDPEDPERYAVQLFTDERRLEKKRMSIKRKNIFAAPSTPRERKVLLEMPREEIEDMFRGLAQRALPVDISRAATWARLGHLFGKCALVTWMPPAADRGSKAGWKQSLELAYRLLTHGGCLVQLDKHGLFGGNGFGNAMEMEPFVHAKGMSMIVESVADAHDKDKRLAMVLWKKVNPAYGRMSAAELMAAKMMSKKEQINIINELI